VLVRQLDLEVGVINPWTSTSSWLFYGKIKDLMEVYEVEITAAVCFHGRGVSQGLLTVSF